MKSPVLFTMALLVSTACGQVVVTPPFSDHAVLERNHPLPIWGKAAPGETVHIRLDGKEASAVAAADGRWRAVLPAHAAGGPFELEIRASNTIVLHDILIGEVWIAGGQSNMEFKMAADRNAAIAIPLADDPMMRMLTVGNNPQPDTATTVTGKWEPASPQTVPHFSAVAYYFAQKLRSALKVPVGIISSNVGGTPAEAWTPLAKLESDPLFHAAAVQQSEAYKHLQRDQTAYIADLRDWEKRYNTSDPDGKSIEQLIPPESELWKTVTVPVSNENLPFRGTAVLWVQRAVDLPAGSEMRSAVLELGPLLEDDTVFVNGKVVGHTGYDPARQPLANLSYTVPPGFVHGGRNLITLRMFAHAPTKQSFGYGSMSLRLPASGTEREVRMPLMPEWKFWVESDQVLPKSATESLPYAPNVSPSHTAGALHNGMIAPLEDYAIKGFLWYQGEANAGNAARYPPLMADLIAGWRDQWQEELPFYLVQLPVYSDRNFPAMRAAQQVITERVPKTGMAVTIDLGDVKNIHPTDKKPVGDRLALLALHRTYGEPNEDSGPVIRSVIVEGKTLRLHFDHASGLHAIAGTMPNFVIGGKDAQLVPATATLDGETIVLSNPDIEAPLLVGYALNADAVGCNVYNGAGLPLAPFQLSIANK